MDKNIWQLQDAKNKFSNLVNNAREKGPQIVTKHGEKAVVVLSFEDYKKLSRPKTSLITFFQNSPLAKTDFKISRNKDFPRDIEI